MSEGMFSDVVAQMCLVDTHERRLCDAIFHS